MKARGRSEETSVSLDYLTQLHDLHEDWLIQGRKHRPAPVSKAHEFFILINNKTNLSSCDLLHSIIRCWYWMLIWIWTKSVRNIFDRKAVYYVRMAMAKAIANSSRWIDWSGGFGKSHRNLALMQMQRQQHYWYHTNLYIDYKLISCRLENIRNSYVNKNYTLFVFAQIKRRWWRRKNCIFKKNRV